MEFFTLIGKILFHSKASRIICFGSLTIWQNKCYSGNTKNFWECHLEPNLPSKRWKGQFQWNLMQYDPVDCWVLSQYQHEQGCWWGVVAWLVKLSHEVFKANKSTANTNHKCDLRLLKVWVNRTIMASRLPFWMSLPSKLLQDTLLPAEVRRWPLIWNQRVDNGNF